jgi:hypothetical protein
MGQSHLLLLEAVNYIDQLHTHFPLMMGSGMSRHLGSIPFESRHKYNNILDPPSVIRGSENMLKEHTHCR